MDIREIEISRMVEHRGHALMLIVVYHNMADRIEQKGWVQHTPIDLRGRICATESLIEATRELTNNWIRHRLRFRKTHTPSPSVPLAYNVLCTWVGARVLANWNDAPERTAEEVIKTLRSLADFLEGWTPPYDRVLRRS